MTSVKRKFAAGLIALLISSCASYTGQATKQPSSNCNQDPNLATNINECAQRKGIHINELCITNNNIEAVVKVNDDTPNACYIIHGIYDCVRNAVDPTKIYNLTVSIETSTPSTPPQLVYKGHTGTGGDPDSVRVCVNTQPLADAKTLSYDFNAVKALVSKDALQRGVRIIDLKVASGRCNADKYGRYNSCLQVKGTASAQKLSESQARGIVAALVNKYTGALRINTDNLKVLTTSGKDSRVK